MTFEFRLARAALGEFPALVSSFEFHHADEAELKAVLAEVRAAQRCLDGLVMRIAVRSDQLASFGQAAPAAETMRGEGLVGAQQARREAARSSVVDVAGIEDALVMGKISGAHVDSIARHSTRLSEDQRANVDFEMLTVRARQLPIETFERLVKRTVDRALADHGLADTRAKQAASEFRHWFDTDIGMGRFSGTLDPERYEVLTNAVDQRTASLAAANGSSVAKNKHLAAEALVDLILGTGEARVIGRRLPSVLVVVDHKTAIAGPHGHSICQTEQGHSVAPESAARLCCDASIRRVTLDHLGVPINVGRRYRTATDGQWAAMKATNSTCAWDGCSAPISWCQAHHIREWDDGGKTDLANLVPLCSQHHHRVHEGRWRLTLLPDRSLKIYKPDGSHHTTVPTPMRC